MTHDSMIAIIQAHREGRPIQCRLTAFGVATNAAFSEASPDTKEKLWAAGAVGPYPETDAEGWMPKMAGLNFDFKSWEYRIKPKPREWRVCLASVSCRSAGVFVPFDGIASHDFCSSCIIVREKIQ